MDNQIAGVDPTTIEDTFAGEDVNPTLRRSTRVTRKPERLIETHMLTSYGRPMTCLMIYGPQSKNIAQYYRPMTDPTGMVSVLMTQYSMKQGIKHFGEKGMEAPDD
jgi:hypothetical protein